MTSPWPMGWPTVSGNRFKNIIHIHRFIVIKSLSSWCIVRCRWSKHSFTESQLPGPYLRPHPYSSCNAKRQFHVMGGFLKHLVDVIPWKYGENLEEIPNASSIPSFCFFQLCSLTDRLFLNSASRNLFTVGSSTRKTTITMATKTNFWNEQPT